MNAGEHLNLHNPQASLPSHTNAARLIISIAPVALLAATQKTNGLMLAAGKPETHLCQFHLLLIKSASMIRETEPRKPDHPVKRTSGRLRPATQEQCVVHNKAATARNPSAKLPSTHAL